MRYFKGYSLLLIASLVACSKDNTSTTRIGNWIKRSEFEGVARSGAASFVIDNKAYVGTGFDGTNRLQDFWVYDVDLNQWTQRAAFTGSGRNGAVGFAAAGKGYVGTGYDGQNRLNDFYQYDPAANTWTRKADFAGTARFGAVSFALKDQGYIATGYDGNWLKDNWRYDPGTNTWTQAESLNSGKRQDASSFVINNRAYVCMGTANSTFITDFYAYDADSAHWITLRPIDNINQTYDAAYNFKGSGAASFAMKGKGYIATGTKGALSTAVWEYDPTTDLWNQKTDFEGAARSGATGFTVKDRGFVVLGVSSGQPFDDLYEFDPNAAYNKND
ncbi:Kelch repeat-containing protein [Chitinophaga vietnamensis]|uniref:Kelch repeat-containing protein n=1 Tax=Chitinophaga vietnamensis TaxID=2593957 RepID=UPI001177AAFD|nr:kelch repeat-containing protein [Chitinophaga vietnamensis]